MDTTTAWKNGEVHRTDRFGRTKMIQAANPVPHGGCPLCWDRYCRAMPRNLTKTCPHCKDPAREAAAVKAAPVQVPADDLDFE